MDDIIQSVLWLNENISDYGGDPDNIYLVGHSAGAQFALLASLNNNIIKGTILLDAGPYLTMNREYLFGEKADIYVNNHPIGDYFKNAFGDGEYFSYDEVNPMKIIPNISYCPKLIQFYQKNAKSRLIPNEELNYIVQKYNYESILRPIDLYSHNDFIEVV